MITYREYYSRMMDAEKVLNAAVSHVEFNTTGMTKDEAKVYILGRYIQALSSATMPEFWVNKLCYAIDTLLTILKTQGQEKISFSLWSPEEVEADEELNEMWRTEFVRNSRMCPQMLLGTALMSESMEDFDAKDFVNIQFLHIANYCVSHEVNIAHAVQFV